MTLSQLAQFLENLGWSYQIMTDSVLSCQYQGTFGSTKVLLHLHHAGLRIAINPVLQKPVETGSWGMSVNKLIAALNHESPNIRIGLDREGDLYVKLDLPTQNINFDQFTYVLLNVCQVSEQLMVPVLQAQAYDSPSCSGLMP